MLFLGLVFLFGPLGLLCWILNACSRNRHRQTISEMNRLERQRMRLESPAAYGQLQAEEKAEQDAYSKRTAIMWAWVVGIIVVCAVLANVPQCSAPSSAYATSTPAPTYTDPTEAEKAANWQRILDMEHPTPVSTPTATAQEQALAPTPTPSASATPIVHRRHHKG